MPMTVDQAEVLPKLSLTIQSLVNQDGQCQKFDSSYFDDNMQLLSANNFQPESESMDEDPESSTEDLLDVYDSLEDDQVSFSTANISSGNSDCKFPSLALKLESTESIEATTKSDVKEVPVIIKSVHCLFNSWCPWKFNTPEKLNQHMRDFHDIWIHRCLLPHCLKSFEHE